jgi:hypothetical protein
VREHRCSFLKFIALSDTNEQTARVPSTVNFLLRRITVTVHLYICFSTVLLSLYSYAFVFLDLRLSYNPEKQKFTRGKARLKSLQNKSVSKRALQRYSKCYCVASVVKTFTLKDS